LQQLNQFCKKEKIFGSITAEEVDEYYTKRLLGKNTLIELYHSVSWYVSFFCWISSLFSHKSIENIQIPTLFLNAEDDPLVPYFFPNSSLFA